MKDYGCTLSHSHTVVMEAHILHEISRVALRFWKLPSERYTNKLLQFRKNRDGSYGYEWDKKGNNKSKIIKIKGFFGVEFLCNFPRTHFYQRVTWNEILFVFFKLDDKCYYFCNECTNNAAHYYTDSARNMKSVFSPRNLILHCRKFCMWHPAVCQWYKPVKSISVTTQISLFGNVIRIFN